MITTPFDKLSPSERIIAVHAAYGRAVLAAHSLEARLVALLLMRVAERSSKDTYRKEHDRIDGLSLGSAIREFVHEFEPSETVVDLLKDTLLIRNDLVHRISRRILLAAQESSWEESVAVELLEVAECLTGVRMQLDPFVAEFLSTHGTQSW